MMNMQFLLILYFIKPETTHSFPAETLAEYCSVRIIPGKISLKVLPLPVFVYFPLPESARFFLAGNVSHPNPEEI